MRCGECRTVFNARDHLLVEEVVELSEVEDVAEVKSSRFDFDRSEDIGVAVSAEVDRNTESDEGDHYGLADDTLRIEEEDAIDSSVLVYADHSDQNDQDAGDPLYAPPVFDAQADIFDNKSTAHADHEHTDTAATNTEDDELQILTRSRVQRPRRTGRWVAGSAILMLLALAQWAYLNRDQVMASAQVRSAMGLACGYIGCELEPLRDLEQIEILRRSVYSHPNIEKALIISLAIVNNANFAQDFPVLVIRMANVRGEIVAQRDFLPGDYLDETVSAEVMAPAAPVALTLEIHDPGNDALTFELEFK